ncbi:class I SAM-dependent methyltransferase [Parvicella tangerina]|uniref:Trans-aconitate 2-methyltransferase n=1 Tax=Parvicella tangerina TaxID=2829795 RepID=A0A916JIY4_9FLAO|nr:class I SAM-dependent methyltransferase [Parvicella tangerina]CAG5076332.1 Trans-aconitate 2-methyltransferase [Parvicella tangerina]
MTSDHQIFENNYLSVREKEQRVYTDSQIKKLPYIAPNLEQKGEWILRTKTTNRFLNYIQKQDFKHVLDLGCGNGWFTHLIAKALPNTSVLGGDINQMELDQATRCFSNANLNFQFIDVFDFEPDQQFDLITINAAIQYFPSVAQLLTKVQSLLTEHGEFHVLDSPVYNDANKAEEARQRSIAYYSKMGVPELSNSYHHHTWQDFSTFDVLYQPSKNKLVRKIKNDSPFPWLRFTMAINNWAESDRTKI